VTGLALVLAHVAGLALLLVACGGPKQGPPPTAAQRLNAEGVRRLDRGDAAGADQMIHEALKEAELVDDLVAQAEAWNNLGALATARGNAREAWSAHATALRLHQATKTRTTGEVRTRANLGAALLALGKTADAKAEFEEAVNLAERIGEPDAARLARVGLAAVALRAGDAARALALARALAEAKSDAGGSGADGAASSGDAARSSAFALAGAAEEALGDLRGARASYERALDLDRKRDAPRAVAEDLEGLARVAARAGNAADAASFLARSARVARRLGDRAAAARHLGRAIELLRESSPDGAAALEAELKAMQEAPP
jgi:tetratricopeptide (TPR) repeat protein